MITALFLLGCSFACIGQVFKAGASFGPFVDLSPMTVGNAGNFEIGYKLSSNLYLYYEYLYASTNNKIDSYGNPLLHGLGRQKQTFGNGVGIKHYFKQLGKCQPFVGIGFMHMKEKVNDKVAFSNNTILERASNDNTFGLLPNCGIKYESSRKIELSISVKGIINSNTQAVQLAFGLGVPL